MTGESVANGDGELGWGEPVVAVILAAGVGSRLRPLTDDKPKCLVPVGGESFLLRAVRVLASQGIARWVVVTGYRAEAVREAMKRAPGEVRFVHSEAYETTQNSVSFALATRALRAGEACIKLDGDVLFDGSVTAALFDAMRAGRAAGRAGVGVVAVERGHALGEEEMKVLVEGDSVKRFGKGLDPRVCHGESIGIELFDAPAVALVGEALAGAGREGRTNVYYEDVYNDVLDRVQMSPSTVKAGSWTEVDDVADLARAERMFAGK